MLSQIHTYLSGVNLLLAVVCTIIYTHFSEHTNVYTFLKPFSIQFYDDFADEIWRPGFIYRQRLYQLDRASLDYVDELVRYKTDYIVIGPISSDLQRATGQ